MRPVAYLVTASLCMTGPLLVLACSDSNEGTLGRDDAGGDSASSYDAGSEASNAQDAALDGAAMTVRVCTDEGWCHTKLPLGERLRDVWGDGEGGVWAVSEQGNVLRWDGSRWQVSSSGNGVLAAIWGSSPTDLWVGGTSGLLHGRFVGNPASISWTPIDLGEDHLEIEDIAGTSADDVWAVGKDSTVVHAENGFVGEPRAFHLQGRGGSWQRDPIEPFVANPYYSYFTDIHRVWTTANGDVWIHGGLVFPPGHPTAIPRIGSIDFQYRLPHGSQHWEEKPWPAESLSTVIGIETPGFSGVGAVGNDVWLFGYFQRDTEPYNSGYCYWTGRSGAISEGADWQMSVAPSNSTRLGPRGTAVWGLSADDVWIIGENGRLEHWDGTTWTTARTVVGDEPIKADLQAIWGSNSDDIWVVGGQYALHKVPLREATRLNAEAAAERGGGR